MVCLEIRNNPSLLVNSTTMDVYDRGGTSTPEDVEDLDELL